MKTGESGWFEQHVCNPIFCTALTVSLLGSWLARTDPKDVARVESKTVIVTKNQRDTVPIPAGGVKSQLGSWMSESDWERARRDRFPGSMAGTLTRCHSCVMTL